MKQALKYGTVLIGLYIIVANGTNFGSAFRATTYGSSDLVRTFQGRK
jgi:hypothetical protein